MGSAKITVDRQTAPERTRDAAADRPEVLAVTAEQVRARDREALAQVVHAYLPQVLRTARGAGFSAQEAEEVAQETFKTFVETADRFEGRSHVRTWIFGILLRKLQEARRRFGRDGDFEPLDEVFESRFTADGRWARPPRRADAELDRKELGRQIQDCLDAASVQQRSAFLLREVEGLETDEICNILGVSRTNLGVMLHRLRNRARECLEARGIT